MADNFYYVEGNTSVKDLIKNICIEVTQNAGDLYKWNLVYPADINSITDRAIVSTTTSYGYTFYTKFRKPTQADLNSSDQAILQKAERAKVLTADELLLLYRYEESLALTTTEINIIKKDETTLTDTEQQQLANILNYRNITDSRELELLRKMYRGQSLTTDEQAELDVFNNTHSLTTEDTSQINQLKIDKLLTDSIILLIVKEYLAIDLTSSEQTQLENYRISLLLTPTEENRLTQIKASQIVLNHVVMQVGTNLNTNNDDLDSSTSSVPSRFAWYKTVGANIGDWLPVQYWINITKDALNIVFRGDPSADNYPYENYLTSYGYIGALKPIEDSATTDDKYNFGITVSSDIPPTFEKKFGERTATGITDVCMVANKIGMPMQPHYPGFYTTHSFMDKCNTEGSRWNHKKHQFSDITLVHPVDMERGKMINTLAGDASAIYDMDKLAYRKDTVDEEYYKKFKISAPYCFLNNSANNLYCIAIRCYKTTE
ncbi:hypothetical protein [Clostridium sp. DJ247]|uniref:hypothetical protein n=1 Tax=Clostridium sp. DJ247 TaxID=2726188 RepID=UPI001627669D|nr:hypothetical protein [Clostridium sp. DJ247]MBC2580003.1 hypothetical protein [Clostridium sp. DJ247]